MIRQRRSIIINSYTSEDETIASIGCLTREFENAGASWNGIDIEFSIQSRKSGPYAIPKEVAKSVTRMFQTIEDMRKRRLLATSRTNVSNDDCGEHDDKLFLEIGPTICDDEIFRAMIATAIKTMVLTNLKVRGYGNFHPNGTIGNSQYVCDQQRDPSLWEHVESSDSLQNLQVSFHGLDEKCDTNFCSPDEALRLPRLWEAIKRNKSLSSLIVHLYCHVCEKQENEDQLTMLQRLETVSTMKSLSESLKGHPTIRKLDLRYRRDAHQRTVLVPHAIEILEHSELREFKVERFFHYVNIEEFGFPMSEFSQALSKGDVNRYMGKFPMNEFSQALSKCQVHQYRDDNLNTPEKFHDQLEVLTLSNIGLSEDQANELLHCLPDSVKILDISKNVLEDFPEATHIRSSSSLTELNLWKNPCLYNRDQETSLGLLLDLLLKFPCLKDVGPWDKWQFQTHVSYPYLELQISDSLRSLIDRVDTIADQNRCQIRFVPRNDCLVANLSLWPTVLTETTNALSPLQKEKPRKLLEASSKPKEERQANVIYSFLRENISGGIFTQI